MDKAIVKTRLGHYWTPGAGAQTALVVKADHKAETVNLVVFDADGDIAKRRDVRITRQYVTEEKATFHLVSACVSECPEYAR